MNDHHTTNGMHLLRAVSGCFQSNGRYSWGGQGRSFENNMKTCINAAAYYTSTPMPRI